MSRLNERASSNKIIIDIREFRAQLPILLDATAVQIVPSTIAVGDYILSPDICVERKGIADLFQSFASGRLYNQVENMIRYVCILYS
jgi:DNA excision repair protein ERCC-4